MSHMDVQPICTFYYNNEMTKKQQPFAHCSVVQFLTKVNSLIQHVMPGLTKASTGPFKKSPGKPMNKALINDRRWVRPIELF